MASPSEIRLVVFDWAGTTIDFGCMAPAGAFVAAFAERGLTVSLLEARRPMGLHKKDHLRKMLQDPDLAARWENRHSVAWSESDVDKLYGIVTPMQVAAAKKYSELIPGVTACVAKLRSREVKIAATTGYFREAAEVVYDAGKAQGYVPDAVICADEVPAGRPAPWMIFRVMEKLGIYPTHAVVKVGDTVVDIEDGKNAGVWSVGVVDSSNEMGLSAEAFAMLSEEDRDELRLGVRSKFFAAGADAVIQDLSELPPLVAEFNRRLRTGRRL